MNQMQENETSGQLALKKTEVWKYADCSDDESPTKETNNLLNPDAAQTINDQSSECWDWKIE